MIPNQGRSLIVRDLVLLLLAALACLAISFPLVDLSRIHVGLGGGFLNDQVGYISVARSFAETGVMKSHLVYPAVLHREFTRNHMYMPGYYAILGTSYKLFSYGIAQSVLPSLLSFVLGTLLSYALALRLLGRGAALLSALLFLTFPPLLSYSFTAMAELSFVCAGLLGLCLFVYLPAWLPQRLQWLQPFLAPFTLVPAFLIRETGSLLIVPMVALMLWPSPVQGSEGGPKLPPLKERLFSAFVASVGSVALLSALFFSPLCSVRATLGVGNMLVEFASHYGDVLAHKAMAGYTPSKWVGLVFGHILRNVIAILDEHRMLRFEVLVMDAAWVAGLSLSISGALRRKGLALGTGGLLLLILALLGCFYEYFNQRGLRTLLFVFPLVSLCISERLLLLGKRTLGFLLLCLYGFSLVQLHGVYREAKAFGQKDDQDRAFLESLHHDDRTLISAPVDFSMPYALHHHPVDYAFVPANPESLQAIAKRYPIGTLILPKRSLAAFGAAPSGQTPAPIRALGLTLRKVVPYDRFECYIFQ